jgi:phosphatidylserine/phosphatidylglycerophosphate/cardiolipin synthase-like enzyme
MTASRIDDWFLTTAERGNPHTDVDRRRGDGRAWTEGNLAVPLIHGKHYFTRLAEVLDGLGPGDLLHFTDWRGDHDEHLAGGRTLGGILTSLAGRGVQVRGLLWRSHQGSAFSERQNRHLGQMVNEAGGEVLLDQRVKWAGCHHQKLVAVRHKGRPDDDIAFVGGIDLCHGRRDDERHLGDDQAIPMNPAYGERPAWHDVQVELRGPAVSDVDWTFRERWQDPTALDHGNPIRTRRILLAGHSRHPEPIPDVPDDAGGDGPHAVQVLRTFPAKRPKAPYAPDGERSIARAYIKAFERARHLIYIEDQYLWSRQVARTLAAALRRSPDLHLIATLPRYPDNDGPFAGPPARFGREAAIDLLREAGGDRVALFDLEAETGLPVYVHAKVCVVDDVWATIGSDNLNRRSWTHDSELTCAILDSTFDEREPLDPGGLGDRARVFARELRLALWREHLGRAEGDDADLVDNASGLAAWRESAARLLAWDEGGREGERPPGRARPHQPERIPAWKTFWAAPVYRFLVDPDGRPPRLRLARRF